MDRDNFLSTFCKEVKHMRVTIIPHGPTLWKDNYVSIIDPYVKNLLLHQFEEGLYIVKRRAILPPGKEHYAIAIVGRHVRNFDPSSKGPIVIHKTNQPGRHCDSFIASEWERVEKIPEDSLEQVLHRMRISWWEPYNLFLDNCEDWARYVATGKKESFQVRQFVALGLALCGIWWLSSGQN